MKHHRRPILLLGILLIALVLATGYAYGMMSQMQARAMHAAQDLDACQRLADRIHELRRLPHLATAESATQSDITAQIESAARQYKIGPDRLVRISPESPRRLGDSPYREKPTQILMRGVTLQQAIGLLHHLCESNETLQVRSLRISAPRDDRQGDLWAVEASVTYLIFSPASNR